jgi:hypothetical protein
MQYMSYYLIKPNNHLQKALLNSTEDVSFFLLESRLFSVAEGGRTVYVKEDYIERAKLLFLVYLVIDYSDVLGFNEFFGDTRINSDLFDKWWIIERYGLTENFEAVIASIDTDILSQIDRPKSIRLEAWLSNLRQGL